MTTADYIIRSATEFYDQLRNDENVYSDVSGQAFYFRPDKGRVIFGQLNTLL